MVKAVQYRNADDPFLIWNSMPRPLKRNGNAVWRIRYARTERHVRPPRVVVTSPTVEWSPKVSFGERDEEIETLPTK